MTLISPYPPTWPRAWNTPGILASAQPIEWKGAAPPAPAVPITPEQVATAEAPFSILTHAGPPVQDCCDVTFDDSSDSRRWAAEWWRKPIKVLLMLLILKGDRK